MKELLTYWGKADSVYPGEQKWHPLAYHCLDVAAVASVWFESCSSLRGHFLAAFSVEVDDKRLRAWLLFFVALHDLGKFDSVPRMRGDEPRHNAGWDSPYRRMAFCMG